MENGISAIDSSASMDRVSNGSVRARGRTPRVRYLFLLSTACGVGLLLFSLHSGNELLLLAREPLPAWGPRPRAFQISNPFTIDTEGCTIPGLKPFDDNIKKYVTTPDIDPCHNYNFTLLDNNGTHIWLQKEYQKSVDDINISCCYTVFFRPAFVSDIFSAKIDNRVQYKNCTYFSDYVVVENEFVKVKCSYELPNHEIGSYEQFFLFPRKKKLEKRILIEKVKPQSEPAYNVIIMGLDSISRLNFHRTMPKTVAYLEKKNAIELLGYNKVGDNTFPNLMPLLLGIKESELPKVCWPHAKASFDNCPFLWEWFKDVGYYTALGEDTAKLGTFNYERLGFIGSPTDYYLHPFMYEAEKNVGNVHDFNTYLCMGSKYFYQVLLDYVENLTQVLKSSRLFGFFWEVTMSHDYLNYPMFMDNSYVTFLENLDSSGYLDDTFLIFVSDHGIRWGKIRYTKQGRLEERLPLAYIMVPPSFRENYSLAYDHLKINRRRLTTPFDLHATLMDLVSMDTIKNENLKNRSETAYAHDRSISLFLPVPKNRTCQMASIDEHWCTCHKGQKTATDSGEAREAAAHLVRLLNALVAEHAQCARLRLAEVLEVTELLVAGRPGRDEVGWREYLVVVRVTPGGGVFEATLRHDTRGFSLAGAISRLNLYGHQSHCIHYYRLKLYCYCQ